MTIKDIAKLAGVSHSTVSRALNDSPLISNGVKEKIRIIAERNNFEFNTGARSLSTQKTGIIGVVYEPIYDIFGSSLYINQLFRELKEALLKTGYDGIFVSDNRENSQIQRLWRQHKVDGFIIMDNLLGKNDLTYMKEHDIPVVFLHGKPPIEYQSIFDTFATDNTEGGRLAAAHLTSQGCRKLLTITDIWFENPKSEVYHRNAGFQNYLKENGFPQSEMLISGLTFEEGYRLIEKEWDTIKQADGIFAHADIIAFGLLMGLKTRGTTVPEQIRLIGFDDTPICSQMHPYISTIHQPKEEICRLACERIKINIETSIEEKIIHYAKPTLVINEST